MLYAYHVVIASEFNLPQISIDLHPGTLAFVIFCAALTIGLLASLVVLGLYSERRKRNAAHHNQWIDENNNASASSEAINGDASDAEPFVPDSATPDVSASVGELFDQDVSPPAEEDSRERRDEPVA
jgi:hypothetical protein